MPLTNHSKWLDCTSRQVPVLHKPTPVTEGFVLPLFPLTHYPYPQSYRHYRGLYYITVDDLNYTALHQPQHWYIKSLCLQGLFSCICHFMCQTSHFKGFPNESKQVYFSFSNLTFSFLKKEASYKKWRIHIDRILKQECRRSKVRFGACIPFC